MSYDYAYQKRWNYEREQGRTRNTDAAPARAHVNQLLAAGLSMRGIAELAGLSPTVICRLASGDQPTIRRANANRILAVRADAITSRANPDGFVPNLGARRRIRALLALGWTHQHIAQVAGVDTGNVLHQAGNWITRAKHDLVAAAYEQLCMRPGPSQATRDRAAKAGYPPPLAWDDIDDPDEQPTGADRASSRHIDDVDLDEYQRLVDFGEHPSTAARRLGVTVSAIEKSARRRGRLDLARTAATAHRKAAA